MVKLPREPNVKEILDEFKVHCERPEKKLPYVYYTNELSFFLY